MVPKLEGIDSKITETLENNTNLCRKYSLERICTSLPTFFSTPNNKTAINMIREILAKHGKSQLAIYMSRLASIEVGAQKFSTHLRDHISHSIYAFFLGLHLGVNLDIARRITPLSWKLSVLMHDVGYPIELFSRSIDKYLKSVCILTDEIAGEPRPESGVSHFTARIRNFENLKSGRNAFDLINDRLANWRVPIDVGEIYKSMKIH
jgi:hypothetical protein